MIGFANSTSISNCYASGDIRGNVDTGGIIGLSGDDRAEALLPKGSKIINSYFDGNITGDSNSQSIGGLIGNAMLGTIVQKSYFLGTIRGIFHIGGIIGWASGTDIISSYSTVNVSGTEYVGSIVGTSFNVKIIDSYSSGKNNAKELVGAKTDTQIINSEIKN